jgi:hypothetical protein
VVVNDEHHVVNGVHDRPRDEELVRSSVHDHVIDEHHVANGVHGHLNDEELVRSSVHDHLDDDELVRAIVHDHLNDEHHVVFTGHDLRRGGTRPAALPMARAGGGDARPTEGLATVYGRPRRAGSAVPERAGA